MCVPRYVKYPLSDNEADSEEEIGRREKGEDEEKETQK